MSEQEDFNRAYRIEAANFTDQIPHITTAKPAERG